MKHSVYDTYASFCFRRLIEAGGFLTMERDRSCLPKDFPPHLPGTCHFLVGYRHPKVSYYESISEHIRAGLSDIGLKY